MASITNTKTYQPLDLSNVPYICRSRGSICWTYVKNCCTSSSILIGIYPHTNRWQSGVPPIFYLFIFYIIYFFFIFSFSWFLLNKKNMYFEYLWQKLFQKVSLFLYPTPLCEDDNICLLWLTNVQFQYVDLLISMSWVDLALCVLVFSAIRFNL